MSSTPAAPFETEYSEQARDDLQRHPSARTEARAVLERAAGEVQQKLDRGENLALDVFGEAEAMVLRISLVPPAMVRVEGIEHGGPAPEGALRV